MYRVSYSVLLVDESDEISYFISTFTSTKFTKEEVIFSIETLVTKTHLTFSSFLLMYDLITNFMCQMRKGKITIYD